MRAGSGLYRSRSKSESKSKNMDKSRQSFLMKPGIHNYLKTVTGK